MTIFYENYEKMLFSSQKTVNISENNKDSELIFSMFARFENIYKLKKRLMF